LEPKQEVHKSAGQPICTHELARARGGRGSGWPEWNPRTPWNRIKVHHIETTRPSDCYKLLQPFCIRPSGARESYTNIPQI